MESIRILLIDSNEDNYLHTHALINQLPAGSLNLKLELAWIADYGQAIKLLSDHNHDLCIISFPARHESSDGQNTGHQQAVSLIEQAQNQDGANPIILLVEDAQLLDQNHLGLHSHAGKTGIVDYLTKDNYTADTLLRSIRYCLTHARQAQQINKLTAELNTRMEAGNKSLLEALKQLNKSNDELKWQLKEKQAMERSLQESYKLLTAIAENFPSGVISILDRNFNFVFINGRELQVWGLSEVDFTDKNLSDFLPMEAYEMYTEKLRKAFAGKLLTLEHEGGVPLKHQVYSLTVVPIVSFSQRIDHLLIVTENITKHKRAMEEMHKAMEKEKELNALKTKFVSMASHEFRTPLSTIATSATLIDKFTDSADEDKIKKHVVRIKSAIHNLTSIMDEFLSISKLEEGKVDVTPIIVDLPKYIMEIIEELFFILKQGQEIHYVSSGNAHTLVTDKLLLKNVLINLISNASKYSAAGKQIHLKTHISNDTCTIQVQDEGIGIPAADQAHLFEQFFRAGNVAQVQGTGLGLAIVKRYVELMGGTLYFESKERQGTEFTITLPVNILN